VSPDNEVGSRFRAAHYVRRPFVDPVKTPDDRILKGDSRPICRCRHQLSTRPCSTSRLPRRLALTCRRHCSPASTRWSN